MSTHPTHGFTRHGHAVHGKVVDHMPTDTAFQRFNKKLATQVTKSVGTMICFYIFCFLALLSLPRRSCSWECSQPTASSSRPSS